MGLFSRKKRIENQPMPEVPRYPNFQQAYPQQPPTYENQFPQRPEPLPQPRPIPQQGPLQPLVPQQPPPPRNSPQFPELPRHEQAMGFDMPTREPAFLRPQEPQTRYQESNLNQQERPFLPQRQFPPQEQRQERPLENYPNLQRELAAPPRESPYQMPRPSELQRPEEKPVFVKIEQYKEAMQSIQQLKQKLKEIEGSLQRLESIRSQEQNELKACQDNLNKLKERLIAIDKRLFEV